MHKLPYKSSLSFSLVLSLIIGCFTGRLAATPTDLISIGAAIVALGLMWMFSPWRAVVSTPEMQAFRLRHPGIDTSTPTAFAAGLITAATSMGMAAAADATGFGIFMASASALGMMGASFGTISTAMKVLGLLTAPHVFVPLSLMAGIGLTLSLLTKGDTLLEMSVTALRHGTWQSAYRYAYQASQKSLLLAASEKKIAQWREVVFQERAMRLVELRRLNLRLERLAINPHLEWIPAYLLFGAIGGSAVGFIALKFGGSWISVFAAQAGLGLGSAGWNLGAATANIIVRTANLRSDVEALNQINDITFQCRTAGSNPTVDWESTIEQTHPTLGKSFGWHWIAGCLLTPALVGCVFWYTHGSVQMAGIRQTSDHKSTPVPIPELRGTLKRTWRWSKYKVALGDLALEYPQQRVELIDEKGLVLHTFDDSFVEVVFANLDNMAEDELCLKGVSEGSGGFQSFEILRLHDGKVTRLTIGSINNSNGYEVADMDSNGISEVAVSVSLGYERSNADDSDISHVVGWDGSKFSTVTAQFPFLARKRMDAYRESLDYTWSSESDVQTGSIAGFYANALIAGEADLASNWICKKLPSHMIDWFKQEQHNIKAHLELGPDDLQVREKLLSPSGLSNPSSLH